VNDQATTFIIFRRREIWKDYREGELITIYPDQASAIAAADGFSREINRKGRPANWKILRHDEVAEFVAKFVEFYPGY